MNSFGTQFIVFITLTDDAIETARYVIELLHTNNSYFRYIGVFLIKFYCKNSIHIFQIRLD